MIKETKKVKQKILLREGSSLKDLAEKAQIKPKELVEKLASKGFIIEFNDLLDEAALARISKETGQEVELISLEKERELEAKRNPKELVFRPPIVTIMGHVDHGKTTLLDAIRSSHLVEKEFGGITQHIGAYQVIHNGRFITFIDTPGHEAFTQLRARGAKVTDIVVLVIAADEGVMPQTKEAINHAKAAEVPIIVAINKIDKPEANAERVKQQLSKEGLLVEDWGGDTICVEVSAKEKKNINELLEMILLLGDVIEIKANPKVRAQGVVLEARLDSKKGPLATVIVQQGTLYPGDAFVAGTCFGKVRALFDEYGKNIRIAGPSMPVEILGFSDVPQAGDPFLVVESLEIARAVADLRLSKQKKEEVVRPVHITLDDLFKKIEEGQLKELPIIIKADVQGSCEVLRELLPSLETDKIKIKIIHYGTGTITESDILLASASNAIIIGYNVKPHGKILELAKREKVEIRNYKIIYQLTDDIKKAILGMLEPAKKEVYLGKAEIRRIFNVSKVGIVAGCFVIDGKITRNAEIRVIRNKEVIYRGRIASLRHLKDNVAEVKKDMECGIAIEKFKDIQEGDIIEAFLVERVISG